MNIEISEETVESESDEGLHCLPTGFFNCIPREKMDLSQFKAGKHWCVGTPPFHTIVRKGNNFYDFLFPSLGHGTHPKEGQLLKEWICFWETNSFL